MTPRPRRITTTQFSERTLGEMRAVRRNLAARLDQFDRAITAMTEAFGPAVPSAVNGTRPAYVMPERRRSPAKRPKGFRGRVQHVRRGQMAPTIIALLKASKSPITIRELGDGVANAIPTSGRFYRTARGRASLLACLSELARKGKVRREHLSAGSKSKVFSA